MISQTPIDAMTETPERQEAEPKPAVRPLDLSYLIRCAILHGRGYACTPETRKEVRHLTDEDQAVLMSFDPEGLPFFERLDALFRSAALAQMESNDG